MICRHSNIQNGQQVAPIAVNLIWYSQEIVDHDLLFQMMLTDYGNDKTICRDWYILCYPHWDLSFFKFFSKNILGHYIPIS